MHYKDTFARMPALDSIAGQTPKETMLLSFERECEITFKEEIYLVRDNGAVFRRARPLAPRRRLDEVWTFGTLNQHTGYLVIASHVIHRIVTLAFHGPRPSNDHVVDHIDTNRQNNRPENLRWVTRLENILLNPITRARIELAFGSLDAFFENPGACIVPNWDWMGVVTKEQAQESRRRLLVWAEKGQAGKGGTLGDWLYKPAPDFSPPAGKDYLAQMEAAQREARATPSFAIAAVQGNAPRRGAAVVRAAPEPEPLETPSLTASAYQRKWRTPTEFPLCPVAVAGNALQLYLQQLTPGAVFARNRYGESIVVEAGIGSGKTLSIVCSTQTGVKGWTQARVYVDGEAFCHESGGTFFTQEGAMKAHCMAIGKPFDAYEGSIDDYC